MFFKHDAVWRFVHQRRCPNLIDADMDQDVITMIPESEMKLIWKGRWWNPWPHLDHCRQDYLEDWSEAAMTWPMVRQPTPKVRELYLAANAGKTIGL